MKPSLEFTEFGRQFIQDIKLRGETFEEIIESCISGFKGDRRSRLRNFIDGILESELSDEELRRLWNSTPTDIDFREAEDVRTLLRMTRDRL